MATQYFKRNLPLNLNREGKQILLVCVLLPLKRDKNVWHLQAISSIWRPLAFLPVTLSFCSTKTVKSLSFLPPWEFQTPLSLGTPRFPINLPRKWLSQNRPDFTDLLNAKTPFQLLSLGPGRFSYNQVCLLAYTAEVPMKPVPGWAQRHPRQSPGRQSPSEYHLVQIPYDKIRESAPGREPESSLRCRRIPLPL